MIAAGGGLAVNHPENCEIRHRGLDFLPYPDGQLPGLRPRPPNGIQEFSTTASNHCSKTPGGLDVQTTRDKRLLSWDELRGSLTSRFRDGMTTSSLAPYGWLALLILTNAVVSMLSSADDAAQRGESYDHRRPAYFEITGGSARCCFCRRSARPFTALRVVEAGR